MSKYNWTYIGEEKETSDDKFKYICEYYGVSPEEALKLGTRSSGRKPNLPGSKTCKPVSDMTFEDIWDLKQRDSLEDIFEFYIDQGAWSTFRQTVRHLELEYLHNIIATEICRSGMHIVEYGCGVAPFTTSVLKKARKDDSFKISLTDVEGCEHLTFGAWKLNRIIEDRSLSNVSVDVKPVTPSTLPSYEGEVDVAISFEVFEHVPDPVMAVQNISKQMKSGGYFVENFIKLDENHLKKSGPDLDTASTLREEYYHFLDENFVLVGGDKPENQPNATRVWEKVK